MNFKSIIKETNTGKKIKSYPMSSKDIKVVYLMGEYNAYLEMVGYTMKRVDITMAMVHVNRELDKRRKKLEKMGVIFEPFKKKDR